MWGLMWGLMMFDVFGNFQCAKRHAGFPTLGWLFSDSVELNFGTGGASCQIYKNCVNDHVDVSSRSDYIINAASIGISFFYFSDFHFAFYGYDPQIHLNTNIKHTSTHYDRSSWCNQCRIDPTNIRQLQFLPGRVEMSRIMSVL